MCLRLQCGEWFLVSGQCSVRSSLSFTILSVKEEFKYFLVIVSETFDVKSTEGSIVFIIDSTLFCIYFSPFIREVSEEQ